MMGIPPSNVPPGSTPSSGRSGESDKGRLKKPFHMPKKGEKDEQRDKKSLFDLAKEEVKQKEGVQEIAQMQDQQVQTTIKGEEAKEVASIQAQAVSKIAELILRMVAQLQVGVVGGKDFAMVDLKGQQNVPSFFANSTLTLSQTEKGLVISFTNFETPQQQASAIQAVEQNKEQLTQLMLNLQTKNIAVAEFQIGSQSISLPRVESLPPPFKPIEPTLRTQTEGERREKEKEEKEGGPKESER